MRCFRTKLKWSEEMFWFTEKSGSSEQEQVFVDRHESHKGQHHIIGCLNVTCGSLKSPEASCVKGSESNAVRKGGTQTQDPLGSLLVIGHWARKPLAPTRPPFCVLAMKE